MSTTANHVSRCIVLGANGYLARNLIHVLVEQCWDVRAFDVSDAKGVEGVPCQKLDLRDPAQVNGVDWNVDAVFLFAGLTGTANGFELFREFVTVNEIGLLSVLDAIRKSGGRPRVVFPSTRLVYRGVKHPLSEDAPKEAKTVYAANKLACELYLSAYANAFGLEYTTYRICVPYGSVVAGDYSYGTVGMFLKQAREKGVITLYGDGSLRRTFSHVEDICRQILRTCSDRKTVNDIFNIGGETLSLGEAATLVANQLGARVEYVAWPERDARLESGDTVFDSSKFDALDAGGKLRNFGDWVASAIAPTPAVTQK